MSAKEMFEEYGYELIKDAENELIYETYSYPEFDDTKQRIRFDKICKTITITQDLNKPCEMSIKELEIIKKQVEELGW